MIDSLAPFGAEQSLAALAPEYLARGIALDVAYLKDGPGLRGALEASGANLYWVGKSGNGRIGWARSLRTLIEDRRPDLIHTTLFEADIAGRIAGAVARVPVVSSLVSDAYGPEHAEDPSIVGWKLRGAQLVDAATGRLVRRFHALTHHSARNMARRLAIPRDRIDVIPRGRDQHALGARHAERRARVRKCLGIGDEERLILAVARQEYQKGLDVLLRAMPDVLAESPDTRLMVAGREGGHTPFLGSLTEHLALRGSVEFLGVRQDVPDLLAAADVFVFPSRSEGFGCSLLEAMALETPIVTSALPAILEVVGLEDVALLVPPNDPSRLSRAIVATLSDAPHAAHRAGLARARFLQRFTIDRVADEMVSFYDRALCGARAGLGSRR